MKTQTEKHLTLLDEIGTPSPAAMARELTLMLANLREVSDSLWQTTATLGVTVGTLENMEAMLTELKSTTTMVGDELATDFLGVGYASRLASLIKDAEFHGVNLLTQQNWMDVLTDSCSASGAQSKVYQSIPSYNMSMDNGPYRIRRLDDGRGAQVSILGTYNGEALFKDIETVGLAIKRGDEPSQTMMIDLKYAKKPKFRCAVISAALRTRFPELGEVPVAFDGTCMAIGPIHGATIEALTVQGPSVGALGALKALLADGEASPANIRAATELALAHAEIARTFYEDRGEEIARMEETTLSVMERVAMVSIMPQGVVAENAAIAAVDEVQSQDETWLKRVGQQSEVIRLMLDGQPDR